MPATDLIPTTWFADPVSSLTHLIGAAVAIVAGVPLIRRGVKARDIPGTERHLLRVVSLVVFVASAVLLLSMSGVYHLIGRDIPARAVFQRIDHAAIFVLIAGTATPVHAIMFRRGWRWGMLGLLWITATLGVTLKSIYFTDFPQGLGLGLYVAMGWFAGVSMVLMIRRDGWRFVMPLLLGGIVYTVGAAVELLEPRAVIQGVVRAHELFHVAVLVALTLQWRFIWTIAGMEGSGGRGEKFKVQSSKYKGGE